jgi:hypothetical protein
MKSLTLSVRCANAMGALVVFMLSTTAATAKESQKIQLTADGKPHLEGIWTAGTLTPYERPAQFGDKAFVTPSEVAAQQTAASERFWASGHKPGEVGRDNDAFIDDDLKLLSNGQTSLIVFPPDGKYPIRPEAERLRDFNLSSADTYETMSQWDRCITREPTTMFPVVYNNAYQLVQTSTHIMIVAEMIHDARIIPLSGEHPDARVRGWGGDPRGRWEGRTLVIDTTNFNEGGWVTTGGNSGRVRGVPYGKDLHIVERFVPVDSHTLNYEITIEDPQHFTSPFKIAYPLHRDDDYRMYEYACHEGNAATELILRGARVQEGATSAK